MTHSSSTAPGASDAQSKDGNGPLSLDALFSAELSGGVLNGPVLLAVIGLVYAVIYYFLFRFLIIRFDFKTPGREDDDVDAFAAAQAAAAKSTGKKAEETRRR